MNLSGASMPTAGNLPMPDKTQTQSDCNRELSFDTDRITHPLEVIKIHPAEKAKRGIQAESSHSFQPDTPENFQDEELLHTLSTISTQSGHSTGSRPDSSACVTTGSGNQSSQPQKISSEALRQPSEAKSDSSPGSAPCGVSPFALCPLPMSRAGSEALPDSPKLEPHKHPRAGIHSPKTLSPSRLRVPGKPTSDQQRKPPLSETTSRSMSHLLQSFPRLEPSSPFQGLLKRTLSRSRSALLQANPKLASASLKASPQPSAELISKTMSKTLSAQLYPGLERAILNWAQQAEQKKLQPADSAPRAMSGMSEAAYPGLDRAISNWAQQAQRDKPYFRPSSKTASRAASGLYPGLERATSDWAQQAQKVMPKPLSTASAMSGMSDMPGLEAAISNWAQQAQQDMPKAALASPAMSGMSDLPGLEAAISKWAEQPQHEAVPSEASMSSAMSGMSDMPGLEQAIAEWAEEAQADQTDSNQASDMPSRAMSGLSQCMYPGLERALSNWAQHAQQDLASTLQAVAACTQQGQPGKPDSIQSAASMPRTMSSASGVWFPGLERAISNWAQQAQHEVVSMLQAASPAPSLSAMSDCLYPGLEHAMSDWAQQAQHDIISTLQTQASAPRAMSGMSETLYPGLERALSNWAQQAQQDKALSPDSAAAMPRALSAMSDAWCPGLERAISNWAQHAQQVCGELPPTQKAECISREASDCLYPGLEQAISDWAKDARFELVPPVQLARALSRSLSYVSEQMDSSASADATKEELLQMAACIVSRSASQCLYPGLEQHQAAPKQQQKSRQQASSTSHGAEPAQAIGNAVLTAAAEAAEKAADSAESSEVVVQAVSEAVTDAVAEAVTEAAPATVTKAPTPEAVVQPSANAVADNRDGHVSSTAPTGLKSPAGAVASPAHHAGVGSPLKPGHADSMLKAHSRDLGQRQHKHAKLHQKLGPGQGFKALDAQPANVAHDEVDRVGTAELPPLTFLKGTKGVPHVRSPGSPADQLGLSVRHRELEEMPHTAKVQPSI